MGKCLCQWPKKNTTNAQHLQQKTCLADGEWVYVRPREPHWDWCSGGTVYCMLCMQCLKRKLPGIQHMSSIVYMYYIQCMIYILLYVFFRHKVQYYGWFCWSNFELKSLNDLTTWGMVAIDTNSSHAKDWWISHVGMQSVLALSKWLGIFFMSSMYASVTL